MPADQPERFVVRDYRPGDEGAILDLFGRSFHQPRTLDQWRWKFQENPWGRERISLAFEDVRLVGHYAGYPVPFLIDGSPVEANQIGDTMTDPTVRHIGRGPSSILGRTALHFYARFCEGRVAFNYGFNVANIQKFSLRFLRSDRVEPVAYRSRDLRADPFPRLSRVERWARGMAFDLAGETSPEWDRLFDRLRRRYGSLVRRDARYVAWRYLRSPEPKYTVVALRKWSVLGGWLVVRKREDRLTIGDLFLDPDHVDLFECALRHLTAVLRVSTVELWAPDRPAWLGAALDEAGLERRPEPQDLSLMCVPFTMTDAVERMRNGLFYTMGDSDLF